MTSQQFLVCDNSTAANYKSWASALSNFIRTAGWTNSSDTGQLNGAGGGNWSGVTTVPGNGANYYEIFQPGDTLTTFYLKVEYGNASGSANAPTMRLSMSTTTNGAGTLTGFVTFLVACGTSFSAPSTTTTYECDLSGTNNRLSILMWRNAPNLAPQIFCVQRSLNATGTPTGTYATLWCGGNANGSGSPGAAGFQQSLHFTVGGGPAGLNFATSSGGFAGCFCLVSLFTNGTSAFNGGIPFANSQPSVGLWDYPCTAIGWTSPRDLTEGVPFTVTNQYGQSVTYMPTRSGQLFRMVAAPFNAVDQGGTVCVEYD